MLKVFFEREQIFAFRELEAKELNVIDERRYERIQKEIGAIQSVAVFLIPYSVGQKTTNLSVYAQVRDYHLYARELSERLQLFLAQKGYEGKCRVCADTSPFAERDAALKAGLGVLGKNGLMIHPQYGSYCFIGEALLTEAIRPEPARDIQSCQGCGACLRACPTGAVELADRSRCLSEITQKKHLTEEEWELLSQAECKWGCDICQSVCPENKNAIPTPIPFFQKDLIDRLDQEILSLSEREWNERAFSWRGRAVLKRNLGCDGSPSKEIEKRAERIPSDGAVTERV